MLETLLDAESLSESRGDLVSETEGDSVGVTEGASHPEVPVTAGELHVGVTETEGETQSPLAPGDGDEHATCVGWSIGRRLSAICGAKTPLPVAQY